MTRYWHIYCHTAPNGKRYIGQTCLEPESRWSNGRGYDTQQYFKRAIGKYGWDNFKHEVLCSASSKEHADFLEQWFIEKYDTFNQEYGYNRTRGGQGAVGATWDEERKRKRSESLSGPGNPMYGHHHPPETIALMSIRRKGKYVSPEMRKFRTDVLLEANKRRRKPVRQLDLKGNVIATYPGMGELERETGYGHSSIWKVCQGHSDKAYGFRWEYVDDDLRAKADAVRKERASRKNRIVQCDMDGNAISVYDSLSDAERKTGLNRDRIGDCCHGGLASYGGYTWRFSKPERKTVDSTPVTQMDLEGNELDRFDSIAEASKHTGIPRYRIRNCCCGRLKSTGGFIWEFQDKESATKKTKQYIGVVQIDLDGNVVARFASLTEAMRDTGYDRHRISECCRGDRDSYCGFTWRYRDDMQEASQPREGLIS